MKRQLFFTYETGLGIIAGLTIAFIIVFFIRMFSPILASLAEEELQNRFNKICNGSVMKYLDNEKNNSDFMEIQHSSNGDIQGITANTVKINKLKSRISLDIQNQLDTIDEITVKIPIGGFFGLGGGFDIPVKLMSVTVLDADIHSSFESVGINQTKLSVNATVCLSGKLLAIGKENPVKIKTKVPVLMTVIVGQVPGTYIDVKK